MLHANLSSVRLITLSTLILLESGCALTGVYVAPVDGPITTIEFVNHTTTHSGYLHTYKNSADCSGQIRIERDTPDNEGSLWRLLLNGEQQKIRFVGERHLAFSTIQATRGELDLEVKSQFTSTKPLRGYSYLTAKREYIGRGCHAYFSFDAEAKKEYQVVISDPSSFSSVKCSINVYEVGADGLMIAIKHDKRIATKSVHDANSPRCKPL